ncbi:hypothetical protein M5U04_16860 [Xenorhabdus sp. XENO-1]|uniref:hypothetical protein n=1 Tax=Xenorhabdus bovienii TaxID=40576 RepID=UPI0020CA87CC|nr:hypothetical protein [Xenorhabdus bovienii]MCP9269707.1 hypothetical protein [Xenorhabdus bovienii subsp. africana]
MPKHPHAELWTKYAEFAQVMDNPWSQFQYWNYNDECWCDLDENDGLWGTAKYRLKPRTIKIGEIDVPEPVREALEEFTEYYCPDINTFGTSDADCHLWDGCDNDNDRLQSGLIHLDRGSAELHAKALIALTSK